MLIVETDVLILGVSIVCHVFLFSFCVSQDHLVEFGSHNVLNVVLESFVNFINDFGEVFVGDIESNSERLLDLIVSSSNIRIVPQLWLHCINSGNLILLFEIIEVLSMRIKPKD
jgi:hypothetical protein